MPPVAEGRIRTWARRLLRDVTALWLAAGSRRTPTAARLTAAAVAAYAFSPIDLIPDFIPVLGMLDDIILLPLGIAIAIRLVPPELMARFRRIAARRQGRPRSRAGAVIVILLWIGAVAAAAMLYRAA